MIITFTIDTAFTVKNANKKTVEMNVIIQDASPTVQAK